MSYKCLNNQQHLWESWTAKADCKNVILSKIVLNCKTWQELPFAQSKNKTNKYFLFIDFGLSI